MMSKTLAERRIAYCLLASRRTVDDYFKEYWTSVAASVASTYNIDIEKIERNPELFLKAPETVH